MQWPFLQSCVDQHLLEPIDLFFAQRLLAQTSSKEEAVAAFLALMMASLREGHLCFKPDASHPLGELALKGSQQLPSEICQTVQEGESMPLKPICRFGDTTYFQKNWVYETQFLTHLLRLSRSQPTIPMAPTTLADALNPEQQTAVLNGLSSSLSLIIGGPGTGKTFTAKHLVMQCLDSLSPEARKQFRIALTAPTGKAVTHLQKQMAHFQENGRWSCGTLHALLQLREDGTQKGEAVILADLIIVDECSMIDAKLFASLLAAVPSGSRLVLIGDQGQLPSVEAGSFFADLCEITCFPISELKQSRRLEKEELSNLAEAIGQGDIEKTKQSLIPFSPDLSIAEPHFAEKFCASVKAHFPHHFPNLADPEALLASTERFRILSCLRQGPLGVDAINARLFDTFQSQLPQEGWWAVPILITRNDYTSQLYNGDTGLLIKKMGPSAKKHKIGIDDYAIFAGRKAFPALALPPFEYAYCLSVHKSQGSEYDAVHLLIPEGSERFGKEILYTAVTRCRKSLIVYMREETVEMMLKKSSRKISGLGVRVRSNREIN